MSQAGLANTGAIPEKFRWLRVPLEDAMLFFLGLSVLITLLEMLKELRKKYEWQKALRLFVEKAVMHDFSNREGCRCNRGERSFSLVNVVSNMKELDISLLLKENHNGAMEKDSTIEDRLREAGLIRKLGPRGRTKIEASSLFFCLCSETPQTSWSIAQAMSRSFDPRKMVPFLSGIKTADEMRPLQQVEGMIHPNLDCVYHTLRYAAAELLASRLHPRMSTF